MTEHEKMTAIRDMANKALKDYEPQEEDFCPYDAYGGNMDDAYRGGKYDGYNKAMLDILNILNS